MSQPTRVLVTGGSGFIGSYVVERLLHDGIQPWVLDHSRNVGLPDRVAHIIGDIRSDVDVTEAMAHVDGFIHLAGVLGTQETIGNPKPAIMTNIEGGLNVLQAAAQYDVPGVNIAVGNWWEHNPYSISKNAVEKLASMYNQYRGTSVSVVRALNAYGPGQSVAKPYGTSTVRKIMPSFIMRALHGHDIEVYGDGDQIMDMIFVTDVADFLVDSLYATCDNGAFGDVIEAGTGRDTTVLDIAKLVCDYAGREYSLIKHLPLRPGETPGAIVKADIATHDQLYPEYHGGIPKDLITLEEGVRRTVDFYAASIA